MPSLKILILGGITMLAACASPAVQKGTDNVAAVQKEAADEIRRICALPEPDRDGEIRKVKQESGFAIVCSAN
jgi:hypothetical protein